MDKILICPFPSWHSRYCPSLRKSPNSPNSEQGPNRRNSTHKWRISKSERKTTSLSAVRIFIFQVLFVPHELSSSRLTLEVLFKPFSALMWGCHPSNQHPTSFLFPECWKVCRPFLVPFEFLAWSLEMWHGFMDSPILGLSWLETCSQPLSIGSDSDHH